MYEFAIETVSDWFEVEALFDTAFVPGRTALSSYRLRDDVDPVASLCFIARDLDGVLAGAVRQWPVYLGGEPALLLGPIAVHPTRQGEGLGAALLVQTMEQAVAEGWKRIILIGDEPYYKRFGFTRTAAIGVEFPPPTNPNRILAQAIVPGGMTGISGRVKPYKTRKIMDQ